MNLNKITKEKLKESQEIRFGWTLALHHLAGVFHQHYKAGTELRNCKIIMGELDKAFDVVEKYRNKITKV